MKSLAKAAEKGSVSKRFLEVASGYRNVVVMTHDNPDPDAIASGWALIHLIKKRLQVPVTLIGAGAVVRAENRKMIQLLKPPLEMNKPLHFSKDQLLVLVDCDVFTSNHPAINPDLQPVAVLDHHTPGKRVEARTCCVFEDRRPSVAATASIATSYLKEQGIEPPTSLATAIVYGIRTETKAGQTEYSELDHDMLSWATRLANPSDVAAIEDAPLNLTYFSDLTLAMQSTFLHGSTAFCILPQCQGPEVVGEVADLLVRCDAISNVFCGALYKGRFVCSVRTEDHDKDASKIAVKVLEGLGHGGGHPHRAGGLIKDLPKESRGRQAIFRELKRRWLSACKQPVARSTRLVSKSSIVGHLRRPGC
jgi:nanoRNase/pAp phosphatase (c-di-AMP/oligoRNAs hydrolase)